MYCFRLGLFRLTLLISEFLIHDPIYQFQFGSKNLHLLVMASVMVSTCLVLSKFGLEVLYFHTFVQNFDCIKRQSNINFRLWFGLKL